LTKNISVSSTLMTSDLPSLQPMCFIRGHLPRQTTDNKPDTNKQN